MRLSIPIFLIILFSVLLLLSFSSQAKNGKGGNGFPPGTHFNLNVIAKWSERASGNFTCPEASEYQFDYQDSVTGEPCDPDTYIGDNSCEAVPSDRNVIFIPREGSDGQRIDVVSGGKGKKANDLLDPNRLEVTDWCTESFGGTAASFYLPENRSGYEVYARLVGKPRHKKDDPLTSTTLIPDIESVSTQCEVLDEEGSPTGEMTECQLLHIGSFSSDGVEIFRSGDGSSNGTVKGKGANKAVAVTELFEFTGHVCLRPEPGYYEGLSEYGVDTTGFCLDENDNYICTDVSLCCTEDAIDDDDELFDFCGYRDGGDDQLVTNNYDPTTEPWADPTAGNVLTVGEFNSCPIALLYTEYSVECQGPFVSEWAFNIADIVDYFLTVQNNGGYVLQVRFYPNP